MCLPPGVRGRLRFFLDRTDFRTRVGKRVVLGADLRDPRLQGREFGLLVFPLTFLLAQEGHPLLHLAKL